MHILLLIGAIALLAVGYLLLPIAKPRRFSVANIAEGVHDNGRVTYKADAVVATRWLLAKRGASADAVDICGAANVPIAQYTDEVKAIGDKVDVRLLGGSAKGTTLMVASAAIAQDAWIEPAANGKVATLGGGAGTHYVVGRAITAAAADGDLVEVDPHSFLRVI